jgi:3-hydroxyacyl-CoA dehydrogenase
VARPSDIDAAVIQGIGFPRWLGGPMYQGDLISMTILAERLDMMSMEAPEFWSPAALILQLGDDERLFADLNTDKS